MLVVSTHSSVRTAAADSKAPARIAKVAKNEQRIAFYSGLAALAAYYSKLSTLQVYTESGSLNLHVSFTFIIWEKEVN